MIVDVHSHVMWYPDHISEQFAAEALASKLVKLEQSGGEAYAARLDLHSYDSRPEDHWTACQTADRVVVFGFQARASGIWVPNELIAEYALSRWWRVRRREGIQNSQFWLVFGPSRDP